MPDARSPIVVIGAGPVGLAAAAHLHERGLPTVVLEAGADIAANVAGWAHVSLFSPWRHTVDAAALRLLTDTGWQPPDPEGHPSGGSLIDRYLRPLAATPPLRRAIRLEHRVVRVLRQPGRPRTGNRDTGSFLVVMDTPSGTKTTLASAVIDASGTWRSPTPLGADGSLAAGEAEHAERISYGIPDVLGHAQPRFAGRRVAVVGSGHSAQNVVRHLTELATRQRGGAITWVIRRDDPGRMFGLGDRDPLRVRARVGEQARRLVASDMVEFVTGFRTAAIETAGAGVALVDGDGRRIGPVDEIVANTGFHPDLSLLERLELDLDPQLQCPRSLSPLIDARSHSCATVPAHGVAELRHPEPGLFIVGMKSYGRASTFLLPNGYEQVRSVVAALAGDHDASAASRSWILDVCAPDGPPVTVDLSAAGTRQGTVRPCGPSPDCCGE